MSQNCPHCMTEINDGATTCPGCHAKYRSTFSMDPRTKKIFGFIIIAAVIPWVMLFDEIFYGKDSLSGWGYLAIPALTALAYFTYKAWSENKWWN